MNSKLKHEGDIIIIIKVWIFSCCLWILVGKWYFYSRVFIAWNCCSGYSYIGRVLKLFIYVYFFICLLSFEFSNLSTISINSRVIHYIPYINFIYLLVKLFWTQNIWPIKAIPLHENAENRDAICENKVSCRTSNKHSKISI